MDVPEGEAISSLQSLILDLPPSCIEFCPAHPEYFVVGTYYLERTADAPVEEVQPTGDDDDCNEDVSEAKAASPQSRNGSVIVFRLQDGKAYVLFFGPPHAPKQDLYSQLYRHLLQTIPQPSAVFDLHFQPQQDHSDVFATVSSTGSISFLRLSPPAEGTQEENPTAIVTPLSTLRIPDLGEDVLFTYFTWHPTIRGLMGITTASGDVILVQIHDDYQGLSVLNSSVMQHDLEAWVVAFSPAAAQAASSPSSSSSSSPEPYTLFSGGDDSALKYLTLKLPPNPLQKEENQDDQDDNGDDDEEEQELITPPFPPVTLKDHTAGVTAILPLSLPSLSNTATTTATNSNNPHLVLTGSYDDTIRLFAIHPLHTTYGMRKATLLTEKNLGGGVWRLSVIGTPAVTTIADDNKISSSTAVEAAISKWEVIILASCMHAGTRILRIQGTFTQNQGGEGEISDITADEIEVLGRFEEHKSMNYGSDWSRVESSLVSAGSSGSGGGSGSREESSVAAGKRESEVVCVSTSFYDRLLCVWRI